MALLSPERQVRVYVGRGLGHPTTQGWTWGCRHCCPWEAAARSHLCAFHRPFPLLGSLQCQLQLGTIKEAGITATKRMGPDSTRRPSPRPAAKPPSPLLSPLTPPSRTSQPVPAPVPLQYFLSGSHSSLWASRGVAVTGPRGLWPPGSALVLPAHPALPSHAIFVGWNLSLFRAAFVRALARPGSPPSTLSLVGPC